MALSKRERVKVANAAAKEASAAAACAIEAIFDGSIETSNDAWDDYLRPIFEAAVRVAASMATDRR